MKTMILDNNLENIKMYDESGVDRIFVDLEIRGKIERQGHLDTVISTHHLDDIKRIKPILQNAELLVRANPIYDGSAEEISTIINNGADVVMLPMFKTPKEVELFISYVDGKAKTCLLLETSEALCRVNDILEIDGIDEIHIGLNDLHLAMGLDFMFELMGDGLIEYLSDKFKAKNISFGIGGVAKMDEGILSGNIIIKEHVRLGSSMVILSRTFKSSLNKNVFKKEIAKLHQEVKKAKNMTMAMLNENKTLLKTKIANIVAPVKD
ncbi:aldolase/citrate lyase family protein [Candidatus Thioglobus sp.]|uniref:aldolase/citrate lyase family protein n=1 Tax=Candidatus Thioglobus sp. TaxID=2026721 RepID=UPI003D0BE4E3